MDGYFKSLLFIIMSSFLFISCSSPTESEPKLGDDFFDDFPGQLESDFGALGILKSDGTLWVLGTDTTGHPGIPHKIENLTDVVAIDFLEGGAAAADIRGDIWFWGERMIYSSDTVLTEPTKISHLSGVKSIQMYGSRIHLLRIDGTVWQLQWNPNTPSQFLTPEKIEGMEDIDQISNSLALKRNGRLCSFPHRDTGMPEQDGLIESLENIVQIYEMYHRYSVILKNDNTVWAWGKNSSGTLGNGTTENSDIPVRVVNMNGVKSISVDGSRCLALKDDGTVWFWGLLGLDSTQGSIGQTTPVKIEGLDNVQLMKAAGAGLNIVMKSDNTYWVFYPQNRPEQILF